MSIYAQIEAAELANEPIAGRVAAPQIPKEELYEGGIPHLEAVFKGITEQYTTQLTGNAQQCFVSSASHLSKVILHSFKNGGLTQERGEMIERIFTTAVESFFWTYQDVQNFEEQNMFAFAHCIATEELVKLLRDGKIEESAVEDVFDVLRHRLNNLYKVPNSYATSSAPAGITRGMNRGHLQKIVAQCFTEDRRMLYSLECAKMTGDSIHHLFAENDSLTLAALQKKEKELDHADTLLADVQKSCDSSTCQGVLTHISNVTFYLRSTRKKLVQRMA